MYTNSSAYYDAIYSFKDYEKESAYLTDLIDRHLHSGGRRLLDVACGTGKHIDHLKGRFDVEGVDIEPAFVAIASERHPEFPFHLGDMRDFDLGRRFDVVTCLFSAIGYMKSIDDLQSAVANMGRHLVPGGVLLIEPWFTPEVWRPHTVHLQTVNEPELKIARMVTSLVEGRLAVMDMHHLVGTPEKTEHFVERHEMLLATNEELMEAFRSAGLDATYDPQGLTGRGMVIGALSGEQ